MQAILDGVFYSVANYIHTVLNIAAGFLVRLWVPPSVFGATTLVNGIQGYFNNADSVCRTSIEREVPLELGRGDSRSADEILSTSYVLLTWVVVFESIVFAVLGFLAEDIFVRVSWWVVSVTNFTDSINAADRLALKAQRRFHGHNFALVLGGIFSATALIGLSWWWGYRGFFAALVFGSVMQFLIYRRVSKYAWRSLFRVQLRGPVVSRILSTGIALAVFKLLQQALMTIDRFVVVNALSAAELGYYSLGVTVAARVYTLPQTLAGSYAPRLYGYLGAKDWVTVRIVADKLHRTSVLVSVGISGLVLLLVGPLIHRILPGYSGAITAIQLLMMSAYFQGSNVVGLQTHVGLGRFRLAIVLIGVSVLAALGLNLGLVRYGLTGVAVGQSVALGIYGLTLSWSGGRLLGVRSMIWWSIMGAGLMVSQMWLLRWGGLLVALVWYVTVGLVSAWYLTQLHAIKWREVPSMLRRYFFRGRSSKA